MTVRAAVLLLAGCGAAAATPREPEPAPVVVAERLEDGPCVGGELRLEDVADACAAEEAPLPLPGPEVLAPSIDDPGEVRGAAEVELVARLTNVSEENVRLVAEVELAVYRPEIFDAEGRDPRRPGSEPMAMGALMGPTRTIAVTLRPGASLTLRAPLDLRTVRESCLGSVCSEIAGDPLGPGSYRVRVTTPLVGPEGPVVARGELRVAAPR